MSDNVIDVDEYLAERERDRKPPLRFTLLGEEYEALDPGTRTLHDVADAMTGTLESSVVFIFGEDNLERLMRAPQEALEFVTDKWSEYYGLNIPKSSGSPNRSSRRAVR